jgi:hypothetical protein
LGMGAGESIIALIHFSLRTARVCAPQDNNYDATSTSSAMTPRETVITYLLNIH